MPSYGLNRNETPLYELALEDNASVMWRFIRDEGNLETGSGHSVDFEEENWEYVRPWTRMRREKEWSAHFDGVNHGSYAPQVTSGPPDFFAYGDTPFGPLTIELVFKSDDTSGTQTLLSWKGNDLTRYGWAVRIINGNFHIYYGNYEPTFNTHNGSLNFSAPIQAGIWYHAIIQLGEEGKRILLNGMVKAESTPYLIETGVSSYGFSVGQDAYALEKYKGSLDFAAVYYSYLSDERILARYRSTGFIPEENMSGRMSRATVLQGIQFAKEAIPGFGGAAVMRLKNMEATPKPIIPVGLVRYPGSKAYTDTQVAQSNAETGISGAMDFNLLPLLFDCMFGEATPSEPGGGDAQYREWNPAVAEALDHPATLVMEHGSSRGAERTKYVFCTGLTMRWGKEEAGIEGNLVGQVLDRNITVTPGLPALAAAAIHPKNIGIFMSDDGTNYTKLSDVLSGEVSLAALWAPVFHTDDEEASFDEIRENMPDFGFSVTLEEGTEADTLQAALEDSTLIYLKLRAVGSIIEAGTGVVDPVRAPKLTALATGGTIAAGTKYVCYSYVNGAGETVVSPVATITTSGTTSRIGVSIGTLPANATGFRVYISTTGSGFKLHGATVSGKNTTILENFTLGSGDPVDPSTTGDPPIYEVLTVELPLLVNQTDPGDKDGVYGNTFNFVIADDETFGLAKITVTNSIAAYE